MKIFEVKNIKKRFEGVIALKGANFKLEGPKICGLVGANGSGKTTFANICCGAIKKDEGQFFIDGEEVKINYPKDAKKYGIVLAHQNLSLIPEMTIWENIDLGHEERVGNIFFNNQKAKETAYNFLEELFHDNISMDAKVVNLSPEQKQMVEIAKALSQKPKLLILDEPTAAFDYFHVERLFKKIKELKENNISVIFISHRVWEITRICDIVFAFRNGEDSGVVDFSEKERNEKLIVPLITGKDDFMMNENICPSREFDDSKIVMELNNLSFKNKLKNINIKVREGEIIGIGGLQGQGQEYLTMIFAGAISSTAGRIIFENKEIKLNQPRDAINKGIYLVPGDRGVDGLFMDQSVLNNIIFPRFSLKIDKFFLNLRRLFNVSEEIIKRTSIIPPKKDIFVSNLSGGNQQKVVFGRWLQFSPKVLVLNDPTKGIDIQAKNDLYKIVRELLEQGTSVILYTSSNEELISYCNRVLIMFEGRIVEELNNDDICQEKIVMSSLRVKK